MSAAAATRWIVSAAGFVEPSIGVILSTSGLPSTDHDTRQAVDDFPPSRVDTELSGRGCTTREGRRWTMTAMCDPLPLVIQGLRVFSSAQWVIWRMHLPRFA
jgi:hypothetical protein